MKWKQKCELIRDHHIYCVQMLLDWTKDMRLGWWRRCSARMKTLSWPILMRRPFSYRKCLHWQWLLMLLWRAWKKDISPLDGLFRWQRRRATSSAIHIIQHTRRFNTCLLWYLGEGERTRRWRLIAGDHSLYFLARSPVRPPRNGCNNMWATNASNRRTATQYYRAIIVIVVLVIVSISECYNL